MSLLHHELFTEKTANGKEEEGDGRSKECTLFSGYLVICMNFIPHFILQSHFA